MIRATSLSGIANRYIALTPGPEQPRRSSPTARCSSDGRDDVVVDLDQLFNTLDAADARRACSTSSRASRASTRARRGRPTQAAKYFDPALSTSRALVDELDRDEDDARRASSSDASQVVTALAERRDDLADLVGQREHHRGRDRRRERALAQALGAAAGHAAPRQHHVRRTCARRSTTSTCWSPRPSPRPSTSRRSCASCARSSPTRGRRSPTCARWSAARARQRPDRPAAQAPRSSSVAQPAFAQLDRSALQEASPCSTFIRPVHARARRLAARLRPGRRQLRRQRPLRAHPADLQRVLVRPTRRRAAC